MGQYTEQAEQFLTDTGTVFTIEYQYTGPYFAGETAKRAVYRFTLKNARGEYSGMFGDSIQATEDRAIAAEYRKASTWHYDIKQQARIKAAIKRHKEHPKPTAYDVLACLTKYDPGTFENFCDEYGYDTDSVRAMEIYRSVQKEWDGLRRMFTAEQMEQLLEIA